ncbi:MAG: glycosyltransferase family 9 protein [Pirellulales bacterium]
MSSKLGVFMPNWVGDAVMATPTLRALAGNLSVLSHIAPTSRAKRSRATQVETEGVPAVGRLVGIMQPAVAELLDGAAWLNDRIVFSKKGKKGCSRIGLISAIRKQRLDAVVLLTNSFWTALVVRLAGVPRRIGYARDGRGLLLTDKLTPLRAGGKFEAVPAVDYYLALAELLGCSVADRSMQLHVQETDRQSAEKLWKLLGFNPDRPTIVINSSGAWGAAKVWPADHVESLARRIVRETPWQVLLHCGPAERSAADAVASRIGDPMVGSMGRAGELPVGLTKGVMERAAVVVSTDSGPRHIAVALNRPVISLIGPTDIAWTKTYNRPEIVITADVDCRPCWQKTCPLKHNRCMQELGVEQVFWKIKQTVDRGNLGVLRAA